MWRMGVLLDVGERRDCRYGLDMCVYTMYSMTNE